MTSQITPPIRLSTLGAIELRTEGRGELRAVLRQPKRLALLAYLAVATPRGVQRRDTLVGLFWPELDNEHARGALRQAMHFLRRHLGDDAIVSRGEEEVGRGASVWCDAIAFEQAVCESRTEEALELYRGDFLAGFFVSEAAPEFDQWIEAERARLRSLAEKTAWTRAAEEELEGSTRGAVHWARRAMTLASRDEAALRRLISLLDRLGDRAGAIQAYEEFARDLAREYEAEPSAETQALVGAVRARMSVPTRVAPPADEVDAPVARPAAAPARPVALVGAAPVSASRVRLALAGAMAVVGVTWWLATSSPPAEPPMFTQLTDQPGPELYPSLSPDGASLAYAARSSGNWDIYVQRVGGQNPINLTNDSRADDTQPAFSPDGQRIAFRSERDGGGIFVMGATGESVRRLTDFGYTPAWSPDGKEVVCATAGFVRPDIRGYVVSQLSAVNVATGAKRLLTPTVRDALQPHWSPQGHRIAYWGQRGGLRDIWTIRADGSEPVAVTEDSHLDWNPVWSADGRFLYFSSDRGGSMNLWRIAIDEESGNVLGRPEPITTPSLYSGYIGASRDGARIAYVQQVRTVNLARISFDPARGTVVGEPILITQGLRDVMAPRVSPDGQRVTFFTLGKQEDVFVIRIDGTGLRHLTEDTYRDRGARWSPDGKRVGFFSTRSGRYEIWSMNVDGGDLQQLTDFGCSLGPIWSPDGTRFLCHRLPDQTPVVVALRDSTKHGAPQTLAPWGERGGRFRAAGWSPDGQTLAGHVETPAGPSGIVVYSFESRQYRRLTDVGKNPRWLSDGRRLLFHHEGQIYLVDSHTKKVRHVLSVGAHDVEDFFSLSADNRLLVFGIVVTEADVWMMEIR